MHKVNSRISLKAVETVKADDWNPTKCLEDGSRISVTSNTSTNLQFISSIFSMRRLRALWPLTVNIKLRDFVQMAAIVLTIIFIVVLVLNHRLESANITRHEPLTVTGVAHHRYPLTRPVKTANGVKYKIAVVTDLDHASKVDNTQWKSFYLEGHLIVRKDMTFEVHFDTDSSEIHSSFSQGGRGMELSELIVYNGDLLSVDDRTGIVYKIKNLQAIPWVILADGPGDVTKGFKCEWATVKDGDLYVGGLGKEWTSTTGVVMNTHPQYVKKISSSGQVTHLNWSKHYNAMREEAGFSAPGYMIHESAVWSSVHKKWYFLPRRASELMYDDKLDERRAANIMIVCSEDFSHVEVIKHFGPASLTHGFSSFKFIPDSNDNYILALKSEEDDGKTASYIMVLDLNGNMVMREKKIIGSYKYEGVEFV